MKSQKEKTYDNDLVWARMKYCPYWPARVSQSAKKSDENNK